MILGKDLSYYIKIIQTPLLVVGGWLIFISMIGVIPFLGWFVALVSLPLNWLLKLGASFYVGYKTVKTNRQLLEGLVSGGLFGIGVGIASIFVSLFRLTIHPTLGRAVLGIFGLVFILVGEVIFGSIVAFIGGVIAGGKKS